MTETVDETVDTIVPEKPFDIGDPVAIEMQDQRLEGHIRASIKSNGKQRYSVMVSVGEEDEIDLGKTTLHNVDGVFVKSREGEKLDPIKDLPFDNYS